MGVIINKNNYSIMHNKFIYLLISCLFISGYQLCVFYYFSVLKVVKFYYRFQGCFSFYLDKICHIKRYSSDPCAFHIWVCTCVVIIIPPRNSRLALKYLRKEQQVWKHFSYLWISSEDSSQSYKRKGKLLVE